MTEVCPGCGGITGCTAQACPTRDKGMAGRIVPTEWAITVVNPPRADAACPVLRQVIALAHEAPTLTNREPRTRLLALAESCGPR